MDTGTPHAAWAGRPTYPAGLEWDAADGWWVAWCPDLPGCMSQGRTAPDALANLADARAEMLASGRRPRRWRARLHRVFDVLSTGGGALFGPRRAGRP